VKSTEAYQTAVQKVINSQFTAGVNAAGGEMSNFSTDDYAVRSGQEKRKQAMHKAGILPD